MTQQTDMHVAIIGGGLSGLYTAYLLHQQQIPFTLYEARERFGGRIMSLAAKNSQHPIIERFDLGPSWFWPDMHPLMAQVIEHFNLTAFQQYQTGAHLFDRGRGNAPQRHELGITTSPISMRVVGGMYSLIDAIIATLPNDSLKRMHHVKHIEQHSNEHLALTLDTVDGTHTITHSHAVVAMPLRLFSQHIQTTPTLPDSLLRHCQNTLTWMAAHAKFVAVYDTPFWREQGLSGSASSQTGPLVEIHDASAYQGKAALFGFVGVNAAARKTAGKQTIIDVALAQLTDLFGPHAAEPSDVFLVDWSDERFTATEQDKMGANSHPMYGIPSSLTPVWDSRLILAGTESASDAGGYLEGALSSALHAFQQLHTGKKIPAQ